MEAKIFGIVGLMALVFVVLPVQAQTYPHSTSYGGIQAHSQMLNSQLSVIGARMSLGYVEGGPSVVTPEVQKQRLYVQKLTDDYNRDMAELDAQNKAITDKANEDYEREMLEYERQINETMSTVNHRPKHRMHHAPASSH